MPRSIDDVLRIADPTAFSIALTDLVAQSPRSLAESRPAERVVWCVTELEREVNNGGFSLYFINSAGALASETVGALHRIGAHQAATLLTEAMAVSPSPGPAAAKEVREAQVEALLAPARAVWNRLDQLFFQYPDDLSALLRSFVAAHPLDFK